MLLPDFQVEGLPSPATATSAAEAATHATAQSPPTSFEAGTVRRIVIRKAPVFDRRPAGIRNIPRGRRRSGWSLARLREVHRLAVVAGISGRFRLLCLDQCGGAEASGQQEDSVEWQGHDRICIEVGNCMMEVRRNDRMSALIPSVSMCFRRLPGQHAGTERARLII